MKQIINGIIRALMAAGAGGLIIHGIPADIISPQDLATLWHNFQLIFANMKAVIGEAVVVGTIIWSVWEKIKAMREKKPLLT